MTTDFEREYTGNVSLAHRKKFAQFFTPQNVAELMCHWLMGGKNMETVLEPAFGLGVFSRILLASKPCLKIKGFDIDPQIFNKAHEIFASTGNVSLLLQDYMYNDWNNRYDGIVCNPPYFKFHDYDNKGVLNEIERRIGCPLNGFTNLYTLFLLKSLYQLAEGGRCAYIVPSEFMNSDYGTLVKRWLVKTGMLRYVFVFDFKENVFDDALTTSSILLFANDKSTDKVCFQRIESPSDLSEIKEAVNGYLQDLDYRRTMRLNELDPNVKWRKYYKECNCPQFSHLVPFSDYAKVMRGIATGDNDFFTFSQSKADQYHINSESLLPCVCHSVDIEGLLFRKTDFATLQKRDKKVFLLDASSNAADPNVKAYIKKGESEGVNLRHLTAHRTPWYAIEKRQAAPIWVSVFNRSGLRFVRNEAGVANLTTFHCVYPRPSLFNDVSTDLLFAYLITDTAKLIFEDNVREYGNGLRKFEPNDLNKGRMLDLRLLPDEKKKRIEYLYSENKGQADTAFIHEIDEILSEYFSSAFPHRLRDTNPTPRPLSVRKRILQP